MKLEALSVGAVIMCADRKDNLAHVDFQPEESEDN